MAAKPKLYPGPWEVEFTYLTPVNSVGIERKLALNCEITNDPTPGARFIDIQVQKRGGGSQALSVAVTDFHALYRTGHGNSTTFISATLYKYVEGTYEKNFYSAFDTALGNGNGGGVAQEGHQTQITMRSAKGSYLRVNWMEDIYASKAKVALLPNATGNVYQRMAVYLMSVNGWVKARDGSFPIAAMRLSGTQNEALDNKRTRPNG